MRVLRELVCLGLGAGFVFLALPDASRERASAEQAAAKNAVGGQSAAQTVEVLGKSVRLVDLAHSFDENTIYWPTEIPFRLERGFAGVTAGGWYYSANRFSMAEHSGTHLDAPIHFARGQPSADAVPLARLVGEAVVVDVSAACQNDPDYQITVTNLKAWEAAQGESLAEKLILLRTGYDQWWQDRSRYLGTSEGGAAAVAKLHFPGLAPEAAAWLAAERRIKAVGIDTASIDRGQAKTFGAHVALCGARVPIFENLTNLGELPVKGFTVVALPMKIRGGSGGPLRAIALVPE